MSIFKEINKSVVNEEAKHLVTENLDELSAADIKKLVDHVVDLQSKGSKEDTSELVGQALENIAGMENHDEKTIKHIARAVELKKGFIERGKLPGKKQPIPKANKNSKDFKDLMSG